MMILNDSVAPFTLVHEMTHAVQDLELGYAFNNEPREEGQAFALEAFYGVGVDVAADEKRMRRAGCNLSAVASLWRSFWRKYGVLPSEDWGYVEWSDGKEKLTKNDLFEIYDIFGTKLSCSALAESVNDLLAREHCCFAVKCSGQDTSFEISPGILIDPFFQ